MVDETGSINILVGDADFWSWRRHYRNTHKSSEMAFNATHDSRRDRSPSHLNSKSRPVSPSHGSIFSYPSCSDGEPLDSSQTVSPTTLRSRLLAVLPLTRKVIYCHWIDSVHFVTDDERYAVQLLLKTTATLVTVQCVSFQVDCGPV